MTDEWHSLDVDGDGDAKDLSYEFRFATEIRPPFNDLPVSFFGGAAGIPPVTALDGTGSEGLGLRQRYTMTEVRGQQRTDLGTRKAFNALAVAHAKVGHVAAYANNGHPGVPVPHYHVVLWYISSEQAVTLVGR